MNVLILCKRQYTAKDLLDDQYGRLYEIPESLAQLGHHVTGITTSYRYRPDTTHTSPSGVIWHSINLSPLAPLRWYQHLKNLHAAPPDIIWASSDALHCIAAIALGKKLQTPVVLDLYDNYDHFGLSNIPGIRKAYHNACKQAQALTVVSHSLAEHVRQAIAPDAVIEVIGNGVNAELFQPLDRATCRKKLNLPQNARIIGTAGAINKSRGIDDLFRAFLLMAESDPDLYLAIAGPQDNTPQRYPHPRILNLGVLDWRKVPLFINSLDVAVICNRDDSFGRYCYPLKLQEALACKVPVCAAAVGDIILQLIDQNFMQYPSGSPRALKEKLIALIENFNTNNIPKIENWPEIAKKLEATLLTHVKKQRENQCRMSLPNNGQEEI